MEVHLDEEEVLIDLVNHKKVVVERVASS